MNKTGISNLLGIVLFFMIAFTITFFMAVFLHDIGRTEILDRIDTVAYEVEDKLVISDSMKAEIHNYPVEYSALNIPYDLFFLATFLMFFISSLSFAYMSRATGWFSFFGALTMVLIIFLFITTFTTAIVDWLIIELIINFVGFDLGNTPLIQFYYDNLGIINFIWALLIIMVNKLDFTNRRNEDINDSTLMAGDYER
jgi:hypothetical protein